MRKLGLFLFLSFFFVLTSFAQKPVEIDSVTASLAVDISKISTQSEASNSLFESLEINDFEANRIAHLDSVVDLRSKKLDEAFENFKNQNLALIGKARLDALISSWNLSKIKVGEDRVKVRVLFEETTFSLDNVKLEVVKWTATLKVLNAKESPNELRLSVKKLVKRSSNTEVKLNEKISKLVLIETKISKSLGIISEVDNQLLIASENRSKDIFNQNAPVIWKIQRPAKDTIVNDSLVTDSIITGSNSFFDGLMHLDHANDGKINTSIEFIDSNQNTIYFHIILWILTIIICLRLGKNIVGLEEEENPSFAQNSMFEVRDKLLLSGTYVTILYSAFLYDYIPILISEFVVIALIILNALIQKSTKGANIIKISMFVGLVYILGQLNMETWMGEITFRFFLFAKIGLTYWALQAFISYLTSYQESNSPKLWKKLNKLAKITYVLLIIATIANILGFVKMADLATLLVIQMIVVSFIFYGILVTSNGLVSLIFAVSWSPQQSKSIEFRNSIENATLDIVNLFAALLWIKAILSTVGIYESIKGTLTSIFIANVEIGSISISLQEIFSALIVLILTITISRFIGIIISEGGLGRFNLKRGVPSAISLVVRYSLIGMGFMLAFSVLGLDLGKFSLMAGALGIGIGFGLQNIVSNFISGLILVFERPMQEGDVVEVNSLLGVVKNIGVRSSNIRTFSGSEVVVPNEALISKELINWTLSDPNKRLEVLVGVEYGSDPRFIIELLQEAAQMQPDVQKDPAPIAFFIAFGDSSLNFKLLFWVDYSVALIAKSEVMLNISDILRKNEINIPFPIRTLMMGKGNEKQEVTGELLKHSRKDVGFDANQSSLEDK